MGKSLDNGIVHPRLVCENALTAETVVLAVRLRTGTELIDLIAHGTIDNLFIHHQPPEKGMGFGVQRSAAPLTAGVVSLIERGNCKPPRPKVGASNSCTATSSPLMGED